MLKRRNHKEFAEEIKEITNNEYEVLNEFKNMRTKVKMKHNKCGYEWEVVPYSFIGNSSRCPICKNKEIHNKQRKTQKQFEKEVFNKFGNDFTILGKYINNNTKILVKHNICGNQYNIAPNKLLQKGSCSYCSKCERQDTESFKNKIIEITNGEFSAIGEYINTHTSILIKHNVCGNEFNIYPKNFLKEKRCPICSLSKGETEIRKDLINSNINFQSQYRIENCRNKKPLPFDFAVLDKNNNLIFLIEYDGIQHYKEYGWNNKKENFKRTKINDAIKTNYCLTNNIPLLRIPYWEFNNIENILQDALNKHLFCL